jgi:hypothetical protein
MDGFDVVQRSTSWRGWGRVPSSRSSVSQGLTRSLKGGADGLSGLAVVTPVETVKTKLIQLHMDFVPGVKYIVAKEGLAGIYQGLLATIIKQVSGAPEGGGGWLLPKLTTHAMCSYGTGE